MDNSKDRLEAYCTRLSSVLENPKLLGWIHDEQTSKQSKATRNAMKAGAKATRDAIKEAREAKTALHEEDTLAKLMKGANEQYEGKKSTRAFFWWRSVEAQGQVQLGNRARPGP